MTCQLLPWLLATVLGAVSGEIGDGPDDPYLWLEEVTGEKPLSWVRERNAESTGELARSDRFRALEQRLLTILDSDAQDPGHPEGRPVLLQFLEGREEPAGPLAAHHPGGVSQGQARLGDRARPRRPGQGGEGELGLARGRAAQARIQASPWSRCRAAGPTRPSSASSTWRPSRSSRTASRSPRPRAGSPGAMPTASSWAPTSARARSPIPATRGSPRSGSEGLRSPRRPSSSKARPRI